MLVAATHARSQRYRHLTFVAPIDPVVGPHIALCLCGSPSTVALLAAADEVVGVQTLQPGRHLPEPVLHQLTSRHASVLLVQVPGVGLVLQCIAHLSGSCAWGLHSGSRKGSRHLKAMEMRLLHSASQQTQAHDISSYMCGCFRQSVQAA